MRLILLCGCSALLCSSAISSVLPVAVGVFPVSSSVVTFTGVPEGTEVNGLLVNGVRFTYTVGSVPESGALIIDRGPGVTFNVDPPNIVSTGDNRGTLLVTLPGSATLFGYGYAVLSVLPVVNATTIELFSGTSSVGLLSYSGSPDPEFTGGFAGIESTIPFDRAALTFNSLVTPAFALDTIRFNSTVPEPSSMLMLGAGLLGLYLRLRR